MQHNAVRMTRVLTTPALVFFGLAYMVPLGIFTTYGQVTVLSEGHLPVAYVITLAAVLFTALSYCRMTSALPLSGSAYSYVQKTFGGNLGFLVGWTQLLDYLFLPIINYMAIGIYLHAEFPAIPMWAIICTTIFIVTSLNILGIKLVSSMNMLIIVMQLVFIALFLYLCFQTPIDFDIETLMAPITVVQGQTSGLFAGAAILCLAFLGFDAISTMAEETKDAKRALPRAIMYTVFIAGVMFIIISYCSHLVYPAWQDFLPDTDTATLAVMRKVGGALLASAFTFAYVIGVFASAMTSQASIVRIFYAMGREGVVPKSVFAYIHPRLKTPVLSIIFVGVTSLFALVLSLNMVVSMISFGALIAFTFVNLTVIKHFVIDSKTPHNAMKLFTYLILPSIGVLLTLWLWTSLDGYALTVGLIWLSIGAVYLAFITRGFSKTPPAISSEEVDLIIG
ncbi:APC family permease [Budviciaceae bacterium CWB-B4]|uniref:APC family permease n=1 Tax=Limnobaculum xujianqingii TaxID=2738837 RepID=A0A9D7FSC1_9GAMM|nr:APC family permease [Limnobaculum xujianqingii]MBK5072643.1 APC family permease [Limnobaculum xujianqingii]MBK5175952.1 APC family permease [Limnobaculum xujianqingii]